MYSLQQLRDLKCTATVVVSDAGVEMSPSAYALQFYGVDIGPGLAEGGCTDPVPVTSTLYRFILQVSAGWATGSNRPGCTQQNSSACDPRMFGTLADAVNFAYANGELPYLVYSDVEAWQLVNGQIQPDSARVLPPGTQSTGGDGSTGGLFGLSSTSLLIGAGVILLFFMRGHHGTSN